MLKMCKCANIKPQSQEAYDNMVIFPIPPHMQEYRDNRIKDKKLPFIAIDPCIMYEIQELWANGIKTYGSCCGHNIAEPFVNVDEGDIDKMLSMGYVQNHPDKDRKDTFKLKSV